MKTAPKKDASLSEAILLGAKIAKENGITQDEGSIFEFSPQGKIECACTAGFALIGKYGVDNIEKRRVRLNATNLFERSFEPKKKEFDSKKQCLVKTLTTPAQKDTVGNNFYSLYMFIYGLNDDIQMKARFIAKKLARCGF